MSAPPSLDKLEKTLTARIDELELDSIVDCLDLQHAAIDREAATGKLQTYVNEALAALRFVGPHLLPTYRILEVGSGIGFFAAFLAEQGFDVTELEPVGTGFEFIAGARSALAQGHGERLPHLAIGADDLDPEIHGHFDLIYSLNVLEHLPDWRNALSRMRGVLAPGGRILQSCPNYTVPYEPHFGKPLIPIRPALTERVLPGRITDTGLWRSLNWVTSRQVRRWAADNGLEVEFRQGLLADALARIADDHEFRRRHQGPVATTARLVDRVNLLPVLERLPVGLSTPMQFELRAP